MVQIHLKIPSRPTQTGCFEQPYVVDGLCKKKNKKIRFYQSENVLFSQVVSCFTVKSMAVLCTRLEALNFHLALTIYGPGLNAISFCDVTNYVLETPLTIRRRSTLLAINL